MSDRTPPRRSRLAEDPRQCRNIGFGAVLKYVRLVWNFTGGIFSWFHTICRPSLVEIFIFGILPTNKCHPNEQASEAVKKANRILAIIKRSFSYIDKRVFRQLYKALVRPIIEYGNVIWGPSYIGDQKKIEQVQRRATKLVKQIRNLPYQERMRELKLPSLSFRRKRGDMIAIFKMVQGLTKT